MPYGKTQAEWKALSGAERTRLSQEGTGGTASQQANRLLGSAGTPGQFSTSGSYQVLGGRAPAAGNLLGGSSAPAAGPMRGAIGGTPAQQYVAARTGAAPPVGAYGGAASVGAGSGNMTPTVTQQLKADQNPYIKQLMALSLGQFDKPIDREAERAMTRREQSLSLNEARQMGSQAGRGGLWGSQLQNITNAQQQALAGQEAGFGTRETEARRAILGTMAGIAGEGTRDIASQLAAQQAANELAQKADQALRDYQFRYDDLAVRAKQGQMSSLSDLLRLI